MNLQALEGLIKSITSSFICEGCQKQVGINDVFIKIVNGSFAVLEVNCPKCKKKSLIKSEVISLDITKYLTQKELSTIKKTVNSAQKKKIGNITDEQIVSLDKDLKKDNFNVSDLFE